jgi:hypothetical protein
MGILGIVIFFLLLVYILSWIFNKSKTLSNMSNATSSMTIPATSLPNSGSINYSYSIWIYIDDWSYLYGQEKYIFLRGTMNSLFIPSLTLSPNDNNAIVSISTDDTESFECVIPNIPLQKWTNITISLNNKSLDSYVNGKLVKTCVLPGVPLINSESPVYLTPNGGFSGQTSRFQYWNTPITPQQAWDVYKKGPGGNLFSNLFNQYKIQLNFVKGSQVQASLTI